MMQSPNLQEFHKTEPEHPIPPLIIMGNQDPPLPTAEPMNKESFLHD
jgi:hypothetical protein